MTKRGLSLAAAATFRRLGGQPIKVEATSVAVTYQNTLARLGVIRDVTERS